MDKKLEARIARLEKMLSNESRDQVDWDAAKAALKTASRALDQYDQIVADGGGHGIRYVLSLESDVRTALNALMRHVGHYRTGSDGFFVGED